MNELEKKMFLAYNCCVIQSMNGICGGFDEVRHKIIKIDNNNNSHMPDNLCYVIIKEERTMLFEIDYVTEKWNSLIFIAFIRYKL